ncbi:MAG: cytochrome c oxidase cbb3-type subunit 1 [Verrucomicrobiales bacterium]|jgi:cytochrome c oxidase cbb3-type subunit 1
MTAESSTDDVQLRAEIDRSLRFPLLFFFGSAGVWLVFSSLLGLISSLSLNLPGLFGNLTIFHYGRIYPAHMNALIYGWAIQAGFGVALWIMARLSRVPARNATRLIVAGHLWNFAILVGLLGILFGHGTSIQWMDFPKACWPIMLISYVLIVFELMAMFNTRRDKKPYISQIYLLGAALWFPWIFLTANLFVHNDDGGAVAKATVNAWYTSNLIYMVLAPVALAASYYIVPKVIGRPIYSYGLANVGFWTLALFTGWTGINRIMGGPFPAWMATVGSTATIFLLIPALAVAINQLKTMEGRFSWSNYSPSLRFTVFATVAFVVTVIVGAFLSLHPVAKMLQFTNAQAGYELMAIYGFFTMGMFGAVYFIVPRICGCEWLKGSWIRFHFLFAAYGIATIAGFTLFGGLAEGSVIADHNKDFIVSVELGWSYLVGRILGWIFILLSNVMFVFHIGLMIIRRGRRGEEGPTLLHGEPEKYFEVEKQLAADDGANA